MRRLAAALPLLIAYFSLSALYAWQAWQRQTVTLFSDEIEFVQMSRAVADTGRAALRGGQPALEAALYPYLAAPAWWLDDVSAAFGTIKLLGVLLMTAAIFPAYGLARLFLARPYALFAAVATAAAPALSYSPFLVDEPLAYPASTLALFLIGRVAVAPTGTAAVLAAAACVVAYYVRSQLAVLVLVLAAVLLWHGWRTARMREWRSHWTIGDWVGAVVLVVGAAVGLSAFIGHRSLTWYVATAFFKGRMLEYGLWAVGALAIGIGLLPVIAAFAAIVRPRDAPADPRRDALAVLAVAAFVVFGAYTAVKAAYLSTTFAIVVAERNLIYLYPIVFAGTAMVLERRRVATAALAAATVFVLYLVTSTPYTLAQYPNYEAHGLSIAAFANRILRWPEPRIETTLVLLTLASGLALLALAQARPGRLPNAAATAIGVLVLAWGLTTEIYAANGERHSSDQVYATLPKPPDWVKRTTRDAPTLFVGQGIDAPAAWQVEFWNPNIRWFWGMDGSAPGPGARVTPDLDSPDGTQRPDDLGAAYALAVNGVQLAAPVVTTVGGAVLYRLGGRPVRLAQTTSGVAPDGWMSEFASYTRYAVAGDVRGFVKVSFSRQGACFPELAPARVSIQVGPVGVGAASQPAIARVTGRASGEVAPCTVTPLLVRVPSGPWRVEARVSSTFVPRELDPSLGDNRQLGAVVSFELVPLG